MTDTSLIESLPPELVADADRAAIAVRHNNAWHARYWRQGRLLDSAEAAGWQFRFASLTKIMTAATLLRSATSAGLGLDAPVNACLRGTQVQPRRGDPPVTARMLLTHTSGLCYFKDRGDRYRFHGGEVVAHWPGLTLAEYYGHLIRARLRNATWRYSSHNFGILGLMLEAIEGESFPSLLRRMLLDPLGMSASFLPRSAADLAGITSPDGRALNEVVTPANGLIGTLPDLCVFVDALLGEHSEVLAPTVLQLMFTCSYTIGSRFPGMGLGPVLLRFGKDVVAWHNAAYDNYRGSMILCPRTGEAAVALGHGARFRPDLVTASMIAAAKPDARNCLAYLHGGICDGPAPSVRPVKHFRPGVYLPTGGRLSEALTIRASNGQPLIGTVHRHGALPFTPIMTASDSDRSGVFVVAGRHIRVQFPEERCPATLAIEPFTTARHVPVGRHLMWILASLEITWGTLVWIVRRPVIRRQR